MKVAVVTIAAGRVEHLRRQLRGLGRSTHLHEHYVVAMGDHAVIDALTATPSHALWMDTRRPLPLAAARNFGADVAISAGAELLVFLDVDCIPAPELLDRYVTAAHRVRHPALLCGPVTYLPPPPPRGYDIKDLPRVVSPHPARPAPDDGAVVEETNYDLFWSLSFAVTTETWLRVGGFCTDYAGYGGEDTDYAMKARSVHTAMYWVGGAHAFHQYHPVSDPPLEHVDDILANAETFFRRWGWWPMQGWLDAFAEKGLISYDDVDRRWYRTDADAADLSQRRRALPARRPSKDDDSTVR